MHVAQLNIAHSKAPKGDPIMEDFFANIDRINDLAKLSTGFQWIFDMDVDPLDTDLFGGDAFVVNYSVWENIDSLFEFTYKTAHAEIFRRRKEWFHKIDGMHMALWYVDAGTMPTQQEASKRLQHIQEHGPTPYAFTFKKRFTEEEFRNFVS